MGAVRVGEGGHLVGSGLHLGSRPSRRNGEPAAGSFPAGIAVGPPPRDSEGTMRRIIALSWAAALAVGVGSVGLRADDKAPEPKGPEPAARAGGNPGRPPEPEKKFRDFAEVTKG